MSLTDQDRIETAADNCEVLRARLAKYEDAEGQPVVVVQFSKLIEELRAAAYGHPLDFRLAAMSEAAAALESQAREIERLKDCLQDCRANKEAFANNAIGLQQQLADLKAQQPSGVVVAGMADALRHVIKELDAEACEDIDYAQVSGALGAYELFGQSLNSSPVSAGCKGKDCGATDGVSHSAACIAEHDATVSAGGVDERDQLAAEAAYYRSTLRNVLKDIRDDLVRGGLAESWRGVAETISVVLSNDRAALAASAPSHSEQVRDGWKLVAEVKYTGYEPANTLNWIKGFGLHDLLDGTKLYAEFPGINQITARIEAAEKVHGSLRAAAKALGIDAGYLSRLKSGEKLNPGDDVLAALGLERVTMYRAAAPAPGNQPITDLWQEVKDRRIALEPEYEGPWVAKLYGDEDVPMASAEADTPDGAVRLLLAQQQGGDV